MQHLHLLEFLEEAFRCLVHHSWWSPPSIDNGARGTGKLLLNTQVSEDFAQ
jgi:hypothetical protein